MAFSYNNECSEGMYLYVSPDETRLKLKEFTSELSLAQIKTVVAAYQQWLEDGELNRLNEKGCGRLWQRLKDDFWTIPFHGAKSEETLMIYDALCRELAKRWFTGELAESGDSPR